MDYLFIIIIIIIIIIVIFIIIIIIIIIIIFFFGGGERGGGVVLGHWTPVLTQMNLFGCNVNMAFFEMITISTIIFIIILIYTNNCK